MRLIGKEIKKVFQMTLLASSFVLSSCKNEEIIDYGIEIVETVPEKKQDFSFEKKNVDIKSKVQTKKEKDYIFSQEIKTVISRRARPEKKVKGIYVPAYVAGDEKRFMPILENIKNKHNKDINLKIPKGKIIGLLGKNGMGKSTLIKLINDLLVPTSGKVLINGSSELLANISVSLLNVLYNHQLLRLFGEQGVAAYGTMQYVCFLFIFHIKNSISNSKM